MRSRPLLLCAVSAALLVSTGVASAAKKCNLVSDGSGDANFIGPAGVAPNVNQLDIRSGDVATGKKTLVVVLRLESADGKGAQAAALGMTYQVSFAISGVQHVFKRTLPMGGSAYTDSATANGVAIAGLAVKSDAKTITWTVPRANVPKLKSATKKTVITGIFLQATAPEAHDYAPNDSRPSSATYPDRAPSCVSAA